MRINRNQILFTLLLIAIATVCKFFFGPDITMSGFSPVIAIALFSGFVVGEKDRSFLLPLAALLISDVLIQVLYSQNLFPYAGFYSDQWVNYLLLLTATLIGWAVKGKSLKNLVIGGFASPTIFFLISNLIVWAGVQTSYTKDFSGLMNCYTAGLPFYRNSLIATFIFLPVILIAYNLIVKHRNSLKLA